GRRHVAERTVGVDGDAAVARVGDLGGGEGVAVGVGVVAQHAGGGGSQGGVLVGGVGVVHGHGGVVDGGDGDVDGGDVRIRGALVCLWVVRCGGLLVGGRSVGLGGGAAVAGVGVGGGGDGGAGHVVAVAEAAGGGGSEGGVLVGGEGGVRAARGVVDRVDGDVD